MHLKRCLTLLHSKTTCAPVLQKQCKPLCFSESCCRGVCELEVKQVKDTRWLSQHKAVKNLLRNMCALAEEVETLKCPTAKGLYSFLATYRFIATLHLQADVLPHLARLSKLFQKEDVIFLAIKEQVPVTLVVINLAHT